MNKTVRAYFAKEFSCQNISSLFKVDALISASFAVSTAHFDSAEDHV